ncbi:MAG: prephenate dehydratase [Geminicoccaceae bacterium]|nr:prephenate dehydratase [Geminicoccaceae bacterium]
MSGTAGDDPENRIAYQGQPGANSHIACSEMFPSMTPLPCESFEEAFDAVRGSQARLAMIPVDNTIAGRVADVHHLMPHCGLHIIGEHFLRINFHLLGLKGTTLDDIRMVHSHVHALGQTRDFIKKHGFASRVSGDTAGAAAEIAQRGDPAHAAISPLLAAEIYGLDVLASDIEDAEHNTTRFIILSREPQVPEIRPGEVITSFLFRVRNVPAALYKAMGGFATNGVNMIKLESYIDPSFGQAQFYADVLGHPDEPGLRMALEELRFFAQQVEMLGVYPVSPVRKSFGS